MKNVLIIGASGGIGLALQNAYNKNPLYELVNTLTRSRDNFDITNESNVARNLEKEISIYDVIIVATGGVKINNDDPEKTIKRLNSDAMLKQFSLNALGPALVLKHIHKLIPKNRPCHVIVFISTSGFNYR